MFTATKTDAVAISLSGLCIAHCLVLPVLAAHMALFGVLSEMEWLHKAMVLLALPIAGFAFTQVPQMTERLIFGAIAASGLGLLIAGAFVEAFHDFETQLTVVGALVLAGAHIYRWQSCKCEKCHTTA